MWLKQKRIRKKKKSIQYDMHQQVSSQTRIYVLARELISPFSSGFFDYKKGVRHAYLG
jgi:hypothetical protein